jgi:pyruvate,orthophosphate dikinase
MAYAYAFDHDHGVPPRSLSALLGGKGANLAEMVSVLHLPVPPGFTITTAAWRAFDVSGWPETLDDTIEAHLGDLEVALGRRLGDPRDPLLLSVRSGAAASMPGMLDTVLNLGLNEETVQGLARQTDAVFALDDYRRLLQMFARVVRKVPEHALRQAARDYDTDGDTATVSELRELCDRTLNAIATHGASPFPQDPRVQLRQTIEAVFGSWHGPKARAYRRHEEIDESGGTAVNVQAMVFGNRDAQSGTGVVFTRDPTTGEARPYGDILFRSQGEDVVSGAFATEDSSSLAHRMPEAHGALMHVLEALETHYRDMCDVEFTIESGKLWLLQTRIGKRTGRAAVQMAVDMARQPGWQISKAEALARVSPAMLEQAMSTGTATTKGTPFTRGEPASPGVATGRVYFSADAAVEAADRGENVIMVRGETSPEDVHGMQVSDGILTSRGGLVSHAAVVARAWGIPAVVGAKELTVLEDRLVAGKVVVHTGDLLTVDGTTGEVFLGSAVADLGEPLPAADILLSWADELAADAAFIGASATERLARARQRLDTA